MTTLTTEARRAAQPNYKGERRWFTARLELKVYDKIVRAAAIRGDTLTEYVSAALDTAATADINRDAEHIAARQAARAATARRNNPQTDIEDSLGKVVPLKASDNAGSGEATPQPASRANRRKK